jgi:quercetin dioxygenase-like cupin family protein
MKILTFDAAPGKPITRFGSANVMQTWVAELSAGARMSRMDLEAGGQIGYHQAVTAQLFMILAGAGWVRGASYERVPVAAGQAVLWQQGEWHAAGTEQGMTALVVEGESIALL